MAEGLIIRRYQETDRDAVWVLHYLAEGMLTPDQVPPPVEGDPDYGDIHHIDDIYLRRGGEFLVGVYRNQIVAMGAIERTSAERAAVKRMRVHRAYQRRGFGRAILQALEKRAIELGYTTLHLDTTVDRVPAQQLYLSCGFHEVGHTILGRYWECILYEKEIAPPFDIFPVIASLPSTAALLGVVARTYPLEQPVDCQLLRSYTNDVYLVSTDSERRYILKVYGAGWRLAPEVAYELDALAHLANKGVAAAPAISRRDGGVIGALRAPEGVRYYALFAYAAGTKPSPPFTETLYYHFGRATARMHRALDDFASPHMRTPLDLAYLLDRPLAALRPWLEGRPDDWDFMVRLADTVRAHITSLAPYLDWGVCHGDLSLDNVHITADNAITFYDFDSAGPGWRACDPYGVFQCHRKDGLWEAFLRGYSEIRSFGEADLAAIPYFVPANQLWNIGTEATRLARRSGLWRLDSSYFDRVVTSLREWDAEQL